MRAKYLVAQEVPKDAFGRLLERFTGVVEEWRGGRYGKRDVGAYGEGRIHETANGFCTAYASCGWLRRDSKGRLSCYMLRRESLAC